MAQYNIHHTCGHEENGPDLWHQRPRRTPAQGRMARIQALPRLRAQGDARGEPRRRDRARRLGEAGQLGQRSARQGHRRHQGEAREDRHAVHCPPRRSGRTRSARPARRSSPPCSPRPVRRRSSTTATTSSATTALWPSRRSEKRAVLARITPAGTVIKQTPNSKGPSQYSKETESWHS